MLIVSSGFKFARLPSRAGTTIIENTATIPLIQEKKLIANAANIFKFKNTKLKRKQ